MPSTGRFALIVVAALLLLPAASPGTTGSGLYGVVKKGPITPVCRVGVPCDAPVAVILVFSRGGRNVARVRSSEQGRYRVGLEPGFYDVRSSVRIGIQKLPKPHAVHVRAAHWDRINLFFDTGIR
jgi:hypothetical protein